ncbi:uncharacterized protein cubi_02646 [Cryptosporidium ubiquitum]|uniref:Uncharacterized protein n=1 Tax=Cryptosporidium ubiquitum TaxID=857276 RepID=A0A1J4MGQ0_9CRYT|nr:uncharacterized protein cubi_02646 [Cryptosporidium ubiquitum]OII73434.1 hypothetical protein cubi_02646 [Cryptosporidium ubiquitum]
MNKRKRSKKNRDFELRDGLKRSNQLDIRKLFLRNAPKRTGYRPVPGVLIYPQNFREPRVFEAISHKNLKKECCNEFENGICRCGDIVACPASQEFQSKNSSGEDSAINNDQLEDQNTQIPDPIDFRGLRGMLWSKINPEKFEMFERRFSEPNATGSCPIGLTDNFESPMFFANTQPAPSKLYETAELSQELIDQVNEEDFNNFMDTWQNCLNQIDTLEQEMKINIELQLSIENELDRGIRLLKPRLRQLTISERKFLHICINYLTSQVGFPRTDRFSNIQSMGEVDINRDQEIVHIKNSSWFMGTDAMELVNQHHKIAELQGKLVQSHLNNQNNNSNFLLSFNEMGFEDDESYSNYNRNLENKMINEDSELSLHCRSVLSKYLSGKLEERESSLKMKRNLLVRLSNILKLLESSPLSNFPFTMNNRHMFLNPIGIGRRSICWTVFDFFDLVPSVLKLYRLDFSAKNEIQKESMFSSNVSISSNTHKLKIVMQESFARLRTIRSVFNSQIGQIKKEEVPLEMILFLKQNCNVHSSLNSNTIKNRQMNHGVSDVILCSGMFEWYTPLSLSSTIVEVYPHLEYYDILSYVHLNGVLGESTSLMYIRSLLRLFFLFSSFKDSSGKKGVKSFIFPVKASRVYIRKEESCFLIGPLDLIDLDSKTDLLQDDIIFKKKYPVNLMQCNSFTQVQKNDDIVNYLPPIIRNIITSDDSLFNIENIKLLKNRLLDLGHLCDIFEKIHVYIIGVLLYFCLTGNYYSVDSQKDTIYLNLSSESKELLKAMLNPNIDQIPSIERILDFPALHPERLVGTLGVQNSYNLFQNQISELKLMI